MLNLKNSIYYFLISVPAGAIALVGRYSKSLFTFHFSKICIKMNRTLEQFIFFWYKEDTCPSK